MFFPFPCPQELLAEISAPSPLSPDIATLLTEGTRCLSLDSPAKPTTKTTSETTPDIPSPRMKLKLIIEGDSPPSSPTALPPPPKTLFEISNYSNGQTLTKSTPESTEPPGLFFHSTPVAVEMLPSVSVVATETSVLVEQEAELCERESEFEEKLQREAEERLAIRIAYIRLV